jgi:hypothetical protein
MPEPDARSEREEAKIQGGKYQVQMFQSKEGDQFAVASPPKVPDT